MELRLKEKIKGKEVVPNGKYRFRLPRELPKPSKGHTSYFVVEEIFPKNMWDARVSRAKRSKIY